MPAKKVGPLTGVEHAPKMEIETLKVQDVHSGSLWDHYIASFLGAHMFRAGGNGWCMLYMEAVQTCPCSQASNRGVWQGAAGPLLLKKTVSALIFLWESLPLHRHRNTNCLSKMMRQELNCNMKTQVPRRRTGMCFLWRASAKNRKATDLLQRGFLAF